MAVKYTFKAKSNICGRIQMADYILKLSTHPQVESTS